MGPWRYEIGIARRVVYVCQPSSMAPTSPAKRALAQCHVNIQPCRRLGKYKQGRMLNVGKWHYLIADRPISRFHPQEYKLSRGRDGGITWCQGERRDTSKTVHRAAARAVDLASNCMRATSKVEMNEIPTAAKHQMAL